MIRISNVRKSTRFKRSTKAISPVIATLLMIAIAVVASLVVYAWVTGYIGNTTSTAGKAIQIQSFASDPDGNLVVYVQNVGQGDVELNRDQSVYVDSILVPLKSSMPAKIPIDVGQTVALFTDTPYTAGTKVNIKVTTTDGTFMTISGTGSSSSSTTNPTTPPGGGNAAPIASFTSVANGLTVAFTDTSTDSDGTITSWSWNFGDGATSTIQNPDHVYASANTYTVTLTVTDNDGASSNPAASNDVIVTAPQAPQTVTLRPTSDSNTLQLGEQGFGSSHYDKVYDTGSGDGSSTYVYDTDQSSYNTDIYNIANHGSEAGTITSVSVHIRAERSGSTTCYGRAILAISGTSYDDGQTFTLASSWTEYSITFDTNPAGGSWGTDWSVIDSLQAGVSLNSGDTFGTTTSYARCTQVWVEITYIPG